MLLLQRYKCKKQFYVSNILNFYNEILVQMYHNNTSDVYFAAFRYQYPHVLNNRTIHAYLLKCYLSVSRGGRLDTEVFPEIFPSEQDKNTHIIKHDAI